MKVEIKSRDRKLLVIACSALVLVLMIRLAILPAVDAYEAGKIEYEEKSAHTEEMQRLIDSRPANEKRISDGMARLDELSDTCYELMENRQIDELVTGVALAHDLFPSHLSISEQMSGIAGPYLYSGVAAVSTTETKNENEDADAEEMSDEMPDTSSDGEENESSEEAGVQSASSVRRVETSLAVSGTESNMKAFLDDIEENYPAVHIKSFEISENIYMDTELRPVSEVQMNIVLEIYMYDRPEK